MNFEDGYNELNNHQFDYKTLSTKSEKIDIIDDEIKEIARTLVGLLNPRANRWGISAPQIGIHKRIIAYINTSLEVKVLINPKFIPIGSSMQISEEGCLSFPNILAKVRRPKNVLVTAWSLNGIPVRFEATGEEAAIVSHEIDHLDGIIFLEKEGTKITEDVYNLIESIYLPAKNITSSERNGTQIGNRMNENAIKDGDFGERD